MSQLQYRDGFGTASSSNPGDSAQSVFNGGNLNPTEYWTQSRVPESQFRAEQFTAFSKPSNLPTDLPTNRFEQIKSGAPGQLSSRLEIVNEKPEQFALKTAADSSSGMDKKESVSPLSRIYDTFDSGSPSSRWLEQRGYLEAFKSPECTLDMSFSTNSGGGKIGAVMTAPDGSKRTVVSCDDGSTFQRLTAPNGRELVKFLSSGQIVELDPQRA